MVIILKHIFRNIRKNLLSGILIVISLILSTSVLYVNLNINQDLISISHQMFLAFSGGYDITIFGKNEQPLAYGADTFAGDEILPVRYDSAVYPVETPVTALLIASDWETAVTRSVIRLKDGTIPTDPSLVAVSGKTALHYDLSIGDTMQVEVKGEPRSFTVSAICSSLGIFEAAQDGGIELLTFSDDAASANALLLDTASDADTTAQALSDSHPEWDVNLLDAGQSSGQRLQSIRRILFIILAVSMVIGYYVISSVSTLMLDARMPVIGTFRSIGASRRKMSLLLLAENAVYGILGGVGGVCVGELLRFLLAVLYYNVSGSQQKLSLLNVVISLGFAVFLQIAITLVSTVRAQNCSIRETIFRTPAVAAEISAKKTVIGAAAIAAGLLIRLINRSYNYYGNIAALLCVIVGSALVIPFFLQLISRFLSQRVINRKHGPLYLSFRNLAASRMNISSVILTTMVISLTFVIFFCTSSVKSFFQSYEKNYPYDVFIKSCDLPADSYRFLNSVDGVDHLVIEYWAYGKTRVHGRTAAVCFVAAGYYSNGITANGSSEITLEPHHALVDELFAKCNHIRIGSKVHFSSPNGNPRGFTVRIDGYCDSGIFNTKRTTVLLSPQDYWDNVEESPAIIGLVLEDSSKEAALLETLEDLIYDKTEESVSVYAKSAYVSRELDDTQSALQVFSVVPLFTTLLAILGMVNNQIVAYNRKRREYAVLYSVAMNRHQLGKMVFEELVTIFLVGSVAGILLSFWFVRIIRDIIYGLISYVDIRYNVSLILLIFLVAFLALCLTALLPRRMVSKINVIEEIKYE